MLKVGVIGLGGFARTHHRAVKILEEQGVCRLVCGCDPFPESFAQQMEELEFDKRGVKVYDHYLKMLDGHASELDVATIPTPIPLHAEMHKACVERGIAVYLEKPPTVNYAELDEMIETDRRAKKATMVGFNFIVEKTRQDLKKRILSGEFGAVEGAQFCGKWPRNYDYYHRADWPARLMMDGRLVLDSCMSNALAHYIHNTLFWLGKNELMSWEPIAETGAELYRAHDIEGFDTVFARARTESGEQVDIALSHALHGSHSHYEKVICQKATLTYVCGGNWTIDWNDGRRETGTAGGEDHCVENMRTYLRYVSGEISRPLTTLAESKPFVEFCDLVYIASGKITTVPEADKDRIDGGWVAVHGLSEIMDRFMETGRYPSEQGVSWATPGGRAERADLPKLRSVIESML